MRASVTGQPVEVGIKHTGGKTCKRFDIDWSTTTQSTVTGLRFFRVLRMDQG